MGSRVGLRGHSRGNKIEMFLWNAIIELGTGHVVQWQSIGPACLMPWVWSPVQTDRQTNKQVNDLTSHFVISTKRGTSLKSLIASCYFLIGFPSLSKIFTNVHI